MSKNQVKQIKETYEKRIKDRLIEVAQLNENAIKVDWSLEKIEVFIDITQNNNVTMYNFIINGDDPKLETTICKFVGYSALFTEGINGQYVSGINAIPVVTDVNTITTIINTVIDICTNDEDNTKTSADATNSADATDTNTVDEIA